jgi:hypothetical protein
MIFDRILEVLNDVNHVIRVINSFQYGTVVLHGGINKDGIEVATRQQPQPVLLFMPT